MNYRLLQQQAKALRAQGLIAKEFKLNQKASILKAEIERVTTATQAPQNQEMTQEVFNHEFIQVYAKEQLRQEVEGVIAMRLEELRELFQQKHEITNKTFYRYIKKLPYSFIIKENGKKLIQVLFALQADGTYKIAV